jgi:hypothetical protein
VFNYPGWRGHAFRAFQDFTDEIGRRYRFLSVVPSHQQVAVLITGGASGGCKAGSNQHESV